MKFRIYCDRFRIYNTIWVAEWWVLDETADSNTRFNGATTSRFYGGRKGHCTIDAAATVRFGWSAFLLVFSAVRQGGQRKRGSQTHWCPSMGHSQLRTLASTFVCFQLYIINLSERGRGRERERRSHVCFNLTWNLELNYAGSDGCRLPSRGHACWHISRVVVNLFRIWERWCFCQICCPDWSACENWFGDQWCSLVCELYCTWCFLSCFQLFVSGDYYSESAPCLAAQAKNKISFQAIGLSVMLAVMEGLWNKTTMHQK